MNGDKVCERGERGSNGPARCLSQIILQVLVRKELGSARGTSCLQNLILASLLRGEGQAYHEGSRCSSHWYGQIPGWRSGLGWGVLLFLRTYGEPRNGVKPRFTLLPSCCGRGFDARCLLVSPAVIPTRCARPIPILSVLQLG